MDRPSEIRARWEAATKGPWSYDGIEYVWGADGHMVADHMQEGDEPAGSVARVRGHGAEKAGQRPPGSQDANARAIAAAPADIAWLLAEVARLSAPSPNREDAGRE